jgi:predicted membrane channel-forming protein YqfA (hemolysin III family)
MKPRTRKLVGAAVMLGFVLFYALVAMALADSRPVSHAPELLRTTIYIVLGLAWVLPMMPLIVWMERGRLRRR